MTQNYHHKAGFISRTTNLDIFNSEPQTDSEKEMFQQHQCQLAKAIETVKCPECGARLSMENKLCDLGYKYGLECWNCR